MKFKYPIRIKADMRLVPFVLIFFIITLMQIIYFPPNYLITIYQFPISIIYIFLISLFLFFYLLGIFLLKSKKHGILAGSFVIIYLVFRLNNLKEPFFLYLLLALFLVLEFLFTGHKAKPPRQLNKD